MTLDELIAALKELRDKEGGDTRVLVDGYEYGYDNITRIDALDVYDRRAEGDVEDWWVGRYDDDLVLVGLENPASLRALILHR